jgi:hypothetical protein
MSLIHAALLLLAAGAADGFDPVTFFNGTTHGDGRLKVILEKPRTIRVDSVGTNQPDGSLLLEQRVKEEGKPLRLRQWHLRRISPTKFAGTLTDAAGPVAVDVSDGRARIRYRMKGGLAAEQWLTPQPGGRTVANVMRVRKAGIVVARFEETIRKLD